MQAQNEYQQRAQIHLLAKPVDGERPFILSAHPQHRLTRRYQLWALAALAEFFLFGSAAVWLAQFRF